MTSARRRRSGRVLAAALLLATTAVGVYWTAMAAEASTASRLLANPGFEDGLTSWSAEGGVTAVSAPTHSGGSAARIVDTSTTTGVSLRSAPIATVPGEELTATAWMSRASGAGGSLYVEFRRADGSRVSAVSVDATADAGWQQLGVRGVAPDDASTATVLAYHSLASTGTAVWDDVAVTALPPSSLKIANAGFEEVRNPASPTEWRPTVTGADNSAKLVHGALVHGGDGALQTVDRSATTGAVGLLSRQTAASPGQTVTASVWLNQSAGATGQQLFLEFRKPPAAGVSLGDRFDTPPTVTAPAGTGWRQISVSGIAPSGTAGLTVRLYSTQEGVGTTVWDDVSLRTGADLSYAPGLADAAPVLFVGDQRVESTTGLTRVMHPGTKAGADGSLFSGSGRPGWDANPRLSGTVLPDPVAGYRMWYTTSGGLGYAESADGLAWSLKDPGTAGAAFQRYSSLGVVENPAWTSGGGQPRYFMLRTGNPEKPKPDNHYYYAVQSTDGKVWTPVPGAGRIAGWDVANVTWDPTTRLFVAMHKSVPVDYDPPGIAPGPRTVWVSTSTDFRTWSTPRPSFAADRFDDARITDRGYLGTTPWSEVYGMPAMRYGDQYLAVPWVFDIAYSPYRDNADPGPDTGRSHLQLAASRDLVNWSRPDRDDLITPGPAGAWDFGFTMGSTTLLNVQVDGQWQTRFYYGSFAGEHGCGTTVEIDKGWCTHRTGGSRVGLATWPADRFLSMRAGSGGGSLTTRPLDPAGRTLRVNFDPGTTGGALRVEVLDTAGIAVPGYSAADAVPVTGNALSPGATVSWGDRTVLPAGQLRLRFTMTSGDLYAYSVSTD